MSNKFDFKSLETGYAADWPVKVSVPIDGGKVEVQTFMARFRTPTLAEVTELEGMTDDYTARLKRALQIGFVDLAKSESETLTPEMFEMMWGRQHVQLAVIEAYAGFQKGSPAKN